MSAPALALCLALAGATPEVWRHWSDGQAELSGYALTQPRYGQLRKGTAVLIYVTEPFSESARVKADPGKHPDSDVVQVLKLNLVKDFRTGIYDYNLMSSLFVRMDAKKSEPAGAPLKLSFSSQEWCGNMYEALLIDPAQIRQSRYSYFDGEGDEQRSLDRPADSLLFEELFVRVRGLPEPFLSPGEEKKVKLRDGVERGRLLHRANEFMPASLSRSKVSQSISVPAGKFMIDDYTALLKDGTRFVFRVESTFPHRLIAWQGPDGEKAELTGSKRLKYWELNKEGGEAQLEALGLSP